MSQREGTVIMEYHVICVHLLKDLPEEVNKAIKEGWRPQGGVCCHLDRDRDSIWAQAMIKESK